VFDTVYNGFATDELYFVRIAIVIVIFLINALSNQFNHDFGGPPWSKRGRKTAEQ
jgi:hypothetical protein